MTYTESFCTQLFFSRVKMSDFFDFDDNDNSSLYDLFICRDYAESVFSFSFSSAGDCDENSHNYSQRLLCLKSATVPYCISSLHPIPCIKLIFIR